ncbi:unnamed protein product [Ixodes hexagonus]
MKAEEAGAPILLNTDVEKVNHSTIARVFAASLELLWPGNIQYEEVLLLVTNGASYTCKAAKRLKSSLPQNDSRNVCCSRHAPDKESFLEGSIKNSCLSRRCT